MPLVKIKLSHVDAPVSYSLAIIGGFLSLILGLSVLIGWYTHNVELIQVSSAFVPMQFNTAVGFLLSGVGLLAVSQKIHYIGTVCGLTIGSLGLLTLFEYMLGISLGIDEFLMKHYITVQTSHPGRMAPNTALCFSLSGIGLSVLGRAEKTWNSSVTVGSLGSIILGLSFIAITGYAFNIEAAYGWGRLTRMAVHTAIGFMVLGVALIGINLHQSDHNVLRFSSWVPISVGIGFLSFIVSIWQVQNVYLDILTRENIAVETYAIANIVFLIVGVGFVIVLSLAMYFAQVSRINERRSKEANSRLEAEITERQQAEAALKESEEQYRNLFENSEISIWDEDLSCVHEALEKLRIDGVEDLRQYLNDHPQMVSDMATMVEVRHVNKATLKLFGTEAEGKFISQISDKFGPGSIEVFINELCALWDGESGFRAEANYVASDGRHISAIISFNIPKTPDGFKSIPVSIFDITERKRAEEEILSYAKRFKSWMDSTFIGIIHSNATGDILDANDALLAMLGYSKQDLLEKNLDWLSWTPPEFLYLDKKAIEEAADKGFWIPFEKEYYHKDGHRVPIVIGGSLFQEDPDEYVVFVVDMSEQARAAIALAQSEAKFRAIFDTVTVGGIVIDSHGTVESFNLMAQNIFGYTPEEVIGKNVRMLMPEPYTSEHDDYLRRYKETNEPKIIGFGREVSGLRKNGEEFPLHLGVGEMAVESGSLFIASITDLTEIKSIARQLSRSQKMEAIGQLSGGIAHDFNNILGIILGNVDLLQMQITADEKAVKRLEVIRKSTQRAAALTKNLLLFSREQTAETIPSDINLLIADIENLITRSVTPEVEIEHQFAEGLWQTEINPGDFEDALLNLVLNARDAMTGDRLLSLETRNCILDANFCAHNPGAKPGEYVELAVSDTGKGISLELQQKIFDPYFTTKEYDMGTGLGLAMVYGFVKRSGGYIKVYSELGVGTTFKLFLPRAKGLDPAQKLVDVKVGALPRGRETVLIVDDEEELLELAKTQMENLGYRVFTASNGDQALTRLSEEPSISLLFSDVIMPGGMNGYELAEKAMASRPDLKVLLTSGYTKKAIARNVQARFVASILSKPYSYDELAQRVRALIDDAPPAV